jgi:hypothetical protein
MDHDRRCKVTRPPFVDSQALFPVVNHPQRPCGTGEVVALLGPWRRTCDLSGARRMASEVLARVVFFFVVFSGSPALACPSCVSDDPITLYSWEQWKVYTGFARTEEFKFMDSRGQETREITLDASNTTTISVGHTISSRSFVTLTAPYIVNKKGNFQRSGWGDPMATGHYMVRRQEASEWWWPQLEAVVGFKDGRATSVYDYKDPAQLDVFGTGVPQWRIGMNAWHGSSDWKGGLALNVAGPVGTRKTDFGEVRQGVTLGVKALAGYGWGDRQKIYGGINREQTTGRSVDGVVQHNSEIVATSALIAGEAAIAHNATIQLTVQRSAAFGATKNASRSDSVTGALIRSF